MMQLLFALMLVQAQMSSGDLKGTVTDPTGAVLPGATVTVMNTETGIERRTMTDAVGDYRFLVLAPGTYELKIEASGFAAYTRRPIQITVGQSLIIDPQLMPAGIQQEVIVQEAVPLLEPTKIQQSDTITEERIQNLPINERKFLNFSLLTPGVTDDRGLVTFGLPQAPTSGLSFLGQGGRSNNVTIDGVDNNDDAVAAVRSTLSQDAIQEFQINRSNYSAEFGRAAGGLINIVSKSGTNRLHGNIFGFFRNQSLDARNPFAFGENGAEIDPPYSRQQAGFTLGGPIKQDKTFFFLSYEGLRQRESRFVSVLQNTKPFQITDSQRALFTYMASSTNAQMRGLAAALTGALTTTEQVYPETVRLLRANSGAFPFRNSDNNASLRMDHSASSSNQMFGRLSFADVDTVGGSFEGLKGRSRGANYQVQDSAAVFGDTHFVSSTAVNEFRFQFANRDYNVHPADPFGPEININGVAFLGRDFFLPSTRNEKRYQLVDNFTIASGRQELKFGADFNVIPFDTTTEVFLGGRFIFGEAIPLGLIMDAAGGPGTAASTGQFLAQSGRPDLIPNLSAFITSLQSFNLGLPLAYQQGFGNPSATLTNKNIAGYVQDNIRIGSKLTVNAGLRYDFELQPEPVHRDKNNWGPRVGFTYSPTDRTLVRAGYGVYYAPVYEAAAFVARVLDGTQISQVFVPLTGIPQLGITATSAQVWGLARQSGAIGNRTLTTTDIARLGLRPGVTPAVILTDSPNLVNPYSQHFSFGVDREVASSLNVSLNYIGNRGVKLIRSRNTNLRQIGANAFGPVFGPLDPRILQNNQVESSGSSIYHGFALSATKRYSDNYQFQVSYTLSKSIDDTTDFITDLQPANQLNLRGERGLAASDQRHRLVLSGVINTPLLGLMVAPIVTYSTGHPFNLLLGADANGDTQANTDRPALAGRNTGRGPDYLSADLRVAREFRFGADSGYRLEGMFEAFNLFNRVNFSGINNVVGTTPLPNYRVSGRRDVGPTDPLGFTSAFDPRQVQLGLRFRF
jgi:outer membrane receptor protein involved in Fe transport